MLIHAMLLHPQVAPNMTWSYPELERNLSDDRHIVLLDGMSAALFEWSAPGVYEGHMIFLPPVRGRLAIERGRAFLREMAGNYGARMIWGRVLVRNRAARWISRQMGLVSHGVERGHEMFVLEV